ncbi:MAG: hypothetical protein JHD38_22305 [Mycolicibacterium sp.]|nr:hypothetical protein [Mycolicibacterium sp.]
MRFNPPPNWPPVPPGWTPPAGWQPDPSWPPPPQGWPLWVPERTSGGRNGLILGAVGAVLLVAVAAVITVAVTRDKPSGGPIGGPPTTTAAALSDEDQIEKVVAQFEQAWNGQEYDNLRNLMCAEMRADEQFSRANFADMRDGLGQLDLTVTSIEITGKTADTVIENDGTDPDEITFSYENGQWKWCEL